MSVKQSIRRSMLWAAYGDALGFITERCSESTLLHRTGGKSRITALIPWVRRIGGEFGVYAELPIGCYSDDTQLRLATSRSIRGDGAFDVEVFSKIELPVWLSYDLGAGFGTKTAAQSLRKNQIQWNSNFFKSKYAIYINGGGNGAAMRIQPHIWCSPHDKEEAEILRDVVRNTVATHGHVRAVIGAAFHALVLREAVSTISVPGPSQWSHILERLMRITEVIQSDSELTMYWLPNWERENNQKIEKAIEQSVEELREDTRIAEDYLEKKDESSYAQLAGRIGCLTRESAGSGTKTALLAAYLSYVHRYSLQDGLIWAANLLGSDTDTIATMAGAIAGAAANTDPPERVADTEYLEMEAERLYELSQRNVTATHKYPDMLFWKPPMSQIDALGQHEGKWVLQGLGQAIPVGFPIEKTNRNPTVWQWFRLDFGQTVLVRRRPTANTVGAESLPAKSTVTDTAGSFDRKADGTEEGIAKTYTYRQHALWDSSKEAGVLEKAEVTVDSAAAIAVKSRFKAHVVGSLLLQLSGQEDGINKASAFAEIIAKARRARPKRQDIQGYHNQP